MAKGIALTTEYLILKLLMERFIHLFGGEWFLSSMEGSYDRTQVMVIGNNLGTSNSVDPYGVCPTVPLDL